MSLITGVRHPYWTAKSLDWVKWRAVYDGGPAFVDGYLEKYSDREDKGDFERRKKLTPTPNFAKAAVNKIKNSIFQRLTEVARRGGSKSFQDAVQGKDFGVDLEGSSMNAFIGTKLLPDLLVMSRVGVFVDMPQIAGQTLRDAVGKRPYLYAYRPEDILSWCEMPGEPNQYSQVLVRDHVEIYFDETSLPSGTKERYRYMFIADDGKCHVCFYEEVIETDPVTGEEKKVVRQVDINGERTREEMILNITYIPFVILDLTDSLLTDVANHQIALLNLESSDINYSLQSNYPFYTEQSDPRMGAEHLKGPARSDADGTLAGANVSQDDDIEVGSMNGRRYGKGMERPSFIHPSSEPLTASMAKQRQLKDDIQELVNLNLSNVRPAFASAESKQMDERGLDSGLSAIGLVLEHAERRIAFYWNAWETGRNVASIKYPEKWSLKSDAERREDAKAMRDLRDTIPAPTFQRALSKEIARSMLGNKISNEDVDKIIEEIDEAKSYTADPETIFQAVDRGMLDLELAADLLGWPKETVEKAAKQHADRLARIAESQASKNEGNPGARGIGDQDGSPGQSGKQEKAASRDTTTDADTSNKVRGSGKEDANL